MFADMYYIRRKNSSFVVIKPHYLKIASDIDCCYGMALTSCDQQAISAACVRSNTFNRL